VFTTVPSTVADAVRCCVVATVPIVHTPADATPELLVFALGVETLPAPLSGVNVTVMPAGCPP
jgi:hypothetical protein